MASLDPFILQQLTDAQQAQQQFIADQVAVQTLQNICQTATQVYRKQKKILIAGNGGSAADAQHFAGELVSRFFFDRPALPAIALTTDTSIMTAIGNDYGYETLFSRQVAAHGQPDDMLIALSTSGNSPNILKALALAREMGLTTVGLTGTGGGKMTTLCDFIIKVPSSVTPRIQEVHELICHTICAYIEQQIFGNKNA